MNIYEQLETNFGYCYLLTLSHRHDRHIHMEKELTKIGKPYKGNDSFLTYHYTTTFPYNDIIADAITKSGKGRFSKPNEFDCTRSHYNMVKTAYDLGYDSILIIEDDIKFLNNIDIFKKYLKTIPNDWDFIQFGGFSADPNIRDMFTDLRKQYNDVYWYKNNYGKVRLWTTSMYALSRKGMEYYLSFLNKFLWVADGPLYYATDNSKFINTYIPILPLCIQEDKDVMVSDIRNENNDTIDYKNENMYEYGLDKSIYL